MLNNSYGLFELKKYDDLIGFKATLLLNHYNGLPESLKQDTQKDYNLVLQQFMPKYFVYQDQVFPYSQLEKILKNEYKKQCKQKKILIKYNKYLGQVNKHNQYGDNNNSYNVIPNKVKKCTDVTPSYALKQILKQRAQKNIDLATELDYQEIGDEQHTPKDLNSLENKIKNTSLYYEDSFLYV